MSFPTQEDVTAKKNWVEKEQPGSHLMLPFAAGCSQGDMIVVEPWCGIADAEVAAAGDAEVSVFVGENILVLSAEVAGGALFANIGDEVWFDPVTGEYTDTEDAGLYLVGYILYPLNADGVIGFEKRRYVEVGVGT